MRVLFFLFLIVAHFEIQAQISGQDFVVFEYSSQCDLSFYLKDDQGRSISNAGNLKSILEKENRDLIFAVNGGMYLPDQSPQGLFIEAGKEVKAIDLTKEAYGNFYMQPNGIFYIDANGNGQVCKSTDFKSDGVQYATQSGPMLLIDGDFHPRFNKNSNNFHIHNGVGILPDGNILFVMSKSPVRFYDLASYFKERGCKNALYLDGFVSRTYYPQAEYYQRKGGFGVLIGCSIEASEKR